jgi:choline dehydrogenase-like flavoprotein
MSEPDIIIVGGGSAGCLAAARLVRDHGLSVLVLERGKERGPRLLDMPAGYMKWLNDETVLEMHRSEPQPQLDGRGPIIPQARLLGGGSAVNAMVYMRGTAADYDAWDRELGCDSGWSFAELLPCFRRMEANERLNDRFHGIAGPLRVSDPGHLCAMSKAFVLAAQAIGHPRNDDFNGAVQTGVGYLQYTIGDARRCGAVRAFLDPVRGDRRLTVLTEALVTRILIEDGRAVGVAYRRWGRETEVRCGRGVLLAAGALNTPKLLMLSGLGPADQLAAHGIAVARDLPGVGQNLQDHVEIPVVAAAARPGLGYAGQDRGWRMVVNGLQYLLFRTGPVTTIGVEACVFLDPDGSDRPTIQIYCVPVTTYLDRDVAGLSAREGVTLNACLLRPRSRGQVRLRSPDPADRPVLETGTFADPDDLRLILEGLEAARAILAGEPLRSLVTAEVMPGATADRAALEAHARRTAKTNYHPVGTARMGRDGDPMAVLDARLRVRGVPGLRVIDCSAMPTIPAANTNAPVLALAERGVQLLAAELARG